MIATDIVDHVLGFLQSDQDYTSLKTCSVVFPLLVDRHLYSQVTFYISGGTLLYSRSSFHSNDTYVVDTTTFSRMLVDHPHVSNCVRSVRIVLVALRPLVPEHFQAISAILSTLTRIKSLTLTTVGRPSFLSTRVCWPSFGPEFCAVFQNSLRLPSISKADICNIDRIPLDIFKDCNTLTDLCLHNLGFVDGGDISTSPDPRLTSLHVDCRLSDWARINSWVTTLHTLSICFQSRFDFAKFRFLIAACSASLVNLELDCTDYSDPYQVIHSDPPQLRLPLLEHIIFRSNITWSGFPRADVFSANLLIPFLTSIASISPISHIRLTLHIGLFFQCKSATPIPDWSSITNILVQPIFRHPIELHITHRHALCTPEDAALLVDSLEQHDVLKKLQAEGELVLKREEAPHGSRIRMNYPDEDRYHDEDWNAEVISSYGCCI